MVAHQHFRLVKPLYDVTNVCVAHRTLRSLPRARLRSAPVNVASGQFVQVVRLARCQSVVEAWATPVFVYERRLDGEIVGARAHSLLAVACVSHVALLAALTIGARACRAVPVVRLR